MHKPEKDIKIHTGYKNVTKMQHEQAFLKSSVSHIEGNETMRANRWNIKHKWHELETKQWFPIYSKPFTAQIN